MPRPHIEPATWLEYTAICITCRRLRLRAGVFPDHPTVIAHGRDRVHVVTRAREHEALYLQRDEAHAIEIHTREVSVRPVAVEALGAFDAGDRAEGDKP